MRNRFPLLVVAILLTACGGGGGVGNASTAVDPAPEQAPQPPAMPRNVILIMADDFNHWLPDIGYYPAALTPNLSLLARRGVLFADASATSPHCLPSRQAFWSGLSPKTTGIDSHDSPYIRDVAGYSDVVTLNQLFTDNGYYTYGGGKLYHNPSMGPRHTDPENWSDLYRGATGTPEGTLDQWAHDRVKWGAFTTGADSAAETRLAQHFADKIDDYDEDRPFFFALGLVRPHLPWYAPEEFFAHYDPELLPLPPGYRANDLEDAPSGKLSADFSAIREAGVWQQGLRAYLANLSYADYNAGLVLDALQASRHAENTLVVFVGDHGWLLGEKDHWGKYKYFDQANRTTMIIFDPTAAGNGRTSYQAVSLLDIYPTIAELVGLETPATLEGHSLKALLQNPADRSRDRPVFVRLNGVDVIKTNEWRYIRRGDESELYDMVNDPYEWTNLYGAAGHKKIIADLETYLDQARQ